MTTMSTVTMTLTTSASASPTGFAAQGEAVSSFVGNTSSTVLFFLALAVGVFIAVLFIFFTIRYFVRSKYGLHIYPISQRSFLLASPATVPSAVNAPYVSDADLQDQIDYIRQHMYSRGDNLDRTIQSRRRMRRRRRRRRGGRYSRMKKLSEEEVEKLFPQQTYYKWLNGGKEEAHEGRAGVLQEENALLQSTAETTEVGKNQDVTNDVIELSEGQERQLDATQSAVAGTLASARQSTADLPENNLDTTISHRSIHSHHSHHHHNHDEHGIELQNMNLSSSTSNSTNVKPQQEDTELHFTSGTCAICLEVLEDDSMVRGLVCGHVFHAECLDPWLTKRRACCPMCKRDYFYKDENNNSRSAGASNGQQEGESSERQSTTENPTQDTPEGANNNNETITTNNESNETPAEDAPAEAADGENATREAAPDAAQQEGDAPSPPRNQEDNDDDEFNDLDSLDLETIRNDPVLRAMLQELIPIHDRVRLILDNPRYQGLNIEEESKAVANASFSNIFKVIWWKIMGITRENIFNWAVLLRYERYLEERDTERRAANENGTTTENADTGNPENAEPETEQVVETQQVERHQQREEVEEAEGGEIAEGNVAQAEGISRSASQDEQRPSDEARDIVEQRV